MSTSFLWAYDINIKNKGDLVSSITCHEDMIINELIKRPSNIIASSIHLPDGNINYSPENVFDGNSSTCWCPKGNGINEFLIFKIPYGLKGIRIQNGIAANNILFRKNNRIKELYIGIIVDLKKIVPGDLCGKRKYGLYNITYPAPLIKLKDHPSFQDIFLNKIENYNSTEEFWSWDTFKSADELYMVLGIISVYHGTKYNDTCISEIKFIE